MKSNKVFKANVYKCLECNEEFCSKSSGHYTKCECGKSGVDQTEHYLRVIGKAWRTNKVKYFKNGEEMQ